MVEGLHLFETAIGPCAIAWSGQGVVALQLPEADRETTRRRLLARRPDAIETEPPPAIAAVVQAVVALTLGEAVDLTGAPLDLADAPEFERRVWAICHAIPPGQTLTYGDIARRLGDVALSRAVGQALGANPIPIIVPCHRVLAADGRSGGFSGAGGVSTKLRLLNIERAHTTSAPLLFDDLPLAVKGQAQSN